MQSGKLKSGFKLARGRVQGGFATLPAGVSFDSLADMTHTLHDGFPTMSGESWFSRQRVARFEAGGVNLDRWSLMEHTGTHLDAPLHFSADGLSADLIPVEDLFVPVAVIDIRARAAENADASLTPEDVLAWEAQHGHLPQGCCLVMNSGWHRLVNTPRFAGLRQDGNHTPGFHPETADFLLNERDVKGIAVDTLSLDTGVNSDGFPVHCAWLGSGRWGLEAVANLDAIPASGAHFFLGAPKVAGATGGPTRVIAMFSSAMWA